MIRVNCETLPIGLRVTIRRITGLKEELLLQTVYHKHSPVDTPRKAIIEAVNEAYDLLHADLPETPEHS
jgi:hypothetical protein